MKKQKPYGTWPSPISAESVGQRNRLEEVQWDSSSDTLVWLEGRSDRSMLVARSGQDAPRDLLDNLIPRGGVGYGGGEFTLHHGTLIFAEKSGRLVRHSLEYAEPTAITPAFGGVASPALSPDGQWVAYVFSDGIEDCLALVRSDGLEWPVKLARGADFYMQPAWHPSGRMLAWVEWNHPNMPWDTTRIQLAHLDGSIPQITQAHTISLMDHTATQPAFSPDGRWLAFIESGEEWDNLILYDLHQHQRRLLFEGREAHIGLPAWKQGQRHLGWSPDSRMLYFIQNSRGFASLHSIQLDGTLQTIPTAPYTWLSQLAVSPGGLLAMIASAPSIPPRIIVWNGHTFEIAARSGSESISPEFFPAPQLLHWPTPDGSEAYGLYYPPTHPDFSGDGLPPAILNIHGGPTSQAVVSFSAEAAYFTTRGYAYVEVNYRGSTGYGHAYRNALHQRWGDADVLDAISCVEALGKASLADPSRCVIKGGSAGGYTVLNALARYPGVFKTGVCLYGVSNLFTLDMDTHKFEQHYTHSLVGPLPEAAGRYHAWSPAFHAEKIRDPLIIFQGSEDRVVPPAQSEEIVAALNRTRVPHEYVVFEGEGHGFRKSENIARYLHQTERFLMQHVLFSP
ncbi:dipeptidyl aminopeptidase [Anaerolinea thermolimosa]|uniref:S9 family peptidase n=1 Tax=Anaerolinea thermolimosa TaxID=229919 RepID=UPI000783A79B|nr:S9 family peptidase [Anaerolinea thermolimosa]GAP06008.1 dipeptidyl aminopeptidase [Anaerolinea thermolimosa]